MNKTKVRMSPSLLAYQQEMAQRLNEAREEKLRLVARAEVILEPFPFVDIPAPKTAGLVIPPRIGLLDAELLEDDPDCLIQINTADVFGIVHIYVTVRDEAGNLLDSGYAMRDDVCETCWAYFTSIDLRAGTSMVVRAVAMDALGASCIAYQTCTVTDTYRQ